MNLFKPEVGGISYQYLAAFRNISFIIIQQFLTPQNLSQVLSSLLGFFLLGFPPTLAYIDHLAAIEVKILSTVQGEFIITS